MTTITAPRENLYRGYSAPAPAAGARADRVLELVEQTRAEGDTGSSSLLCGHFAVFDQWATIRSWYEGEFLERIAFGAFAKTFAERRDQIRVQFDHGFDPFVGDSPLGPITELREETVGPWYEVPLLDTDYNRDRILPLLQGRTISGESHGSLLGASFRFSVVREEWNEEPGVSEWNPTGLPERTITELKCAEFGPVVFPAYAGASAGVRCLTDHYLERTRELRSAPSDPGAASSTLGEAPDEPSSTHSTARSLVSTAVARAATERSRGGHTR